ncbi:MAG: ATP-binding protein [Ignavibacteria bacterium]|nr:ATP-binding protein [Ignavibacteria bacterium]
MKLSVGYFDALPSKKIYNPIITDYDFEKAICELVDNALDIWIKTEMQLKTKIEICLNLDNQTILVKDNAGGLVKEDLKLIVAPGHTSNTLLDQTIGIFGVGTKRAVVHLAKKIIVKTHNVADITYQVEYDEEWLRDEETWRVEIYKVDEIPANETHIELLKLRYTINSEKVEKLKNHLSEVYAKFLQMGNVEIVLNNTTLKPKTFENFSGHPEFRPKSYVMNVFDGSEKAQVKILAGVCTISSTSEYGVYLYCNNRLIVKSVKEENVGAIMHPECGIAKIFVFINGPAELMPWNSSKSNFNYNSDTFLAIQSRLKEITGHYMKLSRSLSKNSLWADVAKYEKYEVQTEDMGNNFEIKKVSLPVIPIMRHTTQERLKNLNREVLDEKPWTRGLFDSLQVVDLIIHRSYNQRNRIALLVLDSTLEIGLKEFLVFQSGKTYREADLDSIFSTINSSRRNVIKEIRRYLLTGAKYDKYWSKVEFYYKKRCDLVHSTATPNVTDEEIEEYKNVVQTIFTHLFGLRFVL